MGTTNKSDAFQLGTPEYKSAKKIARNTWQYVNAKKQRVTRLHKTDIVIETKPGQYVLNSGGYRTMTTKDRMENALSGYGVRSINGLWQVFHRKSGDTAPFFDGMKLPQDLTSKRAIAIGKKDKALREKIKKFARQALTVVTLPQPDSGDCFGCSMSTADGKYAMGSSCVVSHLKENYFHGSLIVRAMRTCGATDYAIALALQSEKSSYWRKDVAKAIRALIYKQYGI